LSPTPLAPKRILFFGISQTFLSLIKFMERLATSVSPNILKYIYSTVHTCCMIWLYHIGTTGGNVIGEKRYKMMDAYFEQIYFRM
jgi:hypothetical protein